MLVFSPCLDCKYFIDNSDKIFKCKAYPIEIPDEMFFDKSGSLCITRNQNKIHFEPIKIEK